MYYYRIAGLTLRSGIELPSFAAFSCGPSEADALLEQTDEAPPAVPERVSGSLAHRALPDGWFFRPAQTERAGLFASADYSRLRLVGASEPEISGWGAWLVRIALECLLARRGCISLHAAAVELRGEAYVFAGPSGVGKSTRARAWAQALGAGLISGDRPLIRVRDGMLFGVPWDGKEQCFRNCCFPLRALCELRRSGSVYVREMSFSQRRKLLLRQCFLPMWDTDTAAVQMANIARLAAGAEMARAFCGPAEADARRLYDLLRTHSYEKEQKDMKAKAGFALQNVAGEYQLMPTGDNIGRFGGTVLLNETAAFVWEKLRHPISEEDLLRAVLDEYEVERSAASADLRALLTQLRAFGVIEDD